jgi:hypothetical protein
VSVPAEGKSITALTVRGVPAACSPRGFTVTDDRVKAETPAIMQARRRKNAGTMMSSWLFFIIYSGLLMSH